MLMNLTENFYLFYKWNENTQQLTRLVFFHKKLLEFLFRWSKILVMNVIYKTNRFNLSMHNLVDQISLNHTFNADEVFMSETTECFLWFLDHLKRIYRSITQLKASITIISDANSIFIFARKQSLLAINHFLCIWHVKMNIKRYIRDHIMRSFIRSEFIRLVTRNMINEIYLAIKKNMWKILHIETILKFKFVWQFFQTQYENRYSVIIRYIARQWISHKKKLIKIWTDVCLHYEKHAIFITESYHKIIKKRISSIEYIANILKHFLLYMKNRNAKLETKIIQRTVIHWHAHAISLFLKCQDIIFFLTFDKMLKHFRIFNLNSNR